MNLFYVCIGIHEYRENAVQVTIVDGEIVSIINVLNNEDFKFTNIPENIFSFVTIDEIKNLTSKLNLQQLHLVNTDGLSEMLARQIDNMSDFGYQRYVDYQRSIAEKEELLGYGNHILYIGQKTK